MPMVSQASKPAICKPGTHKWVHDPVTLGATCEKCRLVIGSSIDTIVPEAEKTEETPEEAYERAMRGI